MKPTKKEIKKLVKDFDRIYDEFHKTDLPFISSKNELDFEHECYEYVVSMLKPGYNEDIDEEFEIIYREAYPNK